jgi:acyl dehydratase
MGVSMRHVLEQGPMLRSLGGAALEAIAARARKPAKPVLPAPWVSVEVPPPSPDLVRAFLRNAGGDAASFGRALPPHLFPQWALPVAVRALAGVPYPLARGINAGCRLEVRAPLPTRERLHVRARLESVDDDGRRAILTTRVVTGTASAPDALEADVRVFVPLARGRGAPPRRDRPRAASSIPVDARELAYVRLTARAGLDFAMLTGDFNPVHWSPAYARAAGFRTTILHGFATFALAVQAMLGRTASGEHAALRAVEARFTSPVVLPARVGVYVSGLGDGHGDVFVGAAPGGTANLVGSFSTQRRS